MRVNVRLLQRITALTLAVVLGAGSATAGLLVRETEGITMTGADGVRYEGASGITMTGADALLTYDANGITMTGADGITMTGADQILPVSPDGMTYTGTDSVRATSADGITMTGANGITMTGADGITMTGADGTIYRANAVVVRGADGITMTGADGITMTGADGLMRQGGDGITMTGADGGVVQHADGITMTGADQIIGTGTNGLPFNVPTDGITMTGADGIVMNGVTGITMTGADGLEMLTTPLGGVTVTGTDGLGLRSFDPELAALLNAATDDSTFNVVVTYNRPVTEADLNVLRSVGVAGGTRYRALPMVTISATPAQLEAISSMAPVRSIWMNRTLKWDADTSRQSTGVTRAWSDADLTARNNGLGLTGRGVTVAVIDTGVDGTHADLSGRVVRNVKLAEAQPLNFTGGFQYPLNIESLANTDQSGGHGTFVSGVIAGDGTHSGGKYKGVAPGARLVGLSAGDVSLLYVLAGFDYLLQHAASLGVRVVNCSFSANTHYNPNDPVNVATRLLTGEGVNVVFSAGNTGPGLDTMNPYAMAPWVISVGATDDRQRLADFSARGIFGHSALRPTLVAPGVDVVGPRSSTAPLTGVSGLLGGDRSQLTAAELPFYTTARGTSFSAPQVAGTVALMLEANPNLTPAEVRDLLQRTATPLPNYYSHEAGAGFLNAHAAVLAAAFSGRQFGLWRATLDRGQVTFIDEPAQKFSGTVVPGVPHNTYFDVPAGALLTNVEIAWGPVWSTNDLALTIYDSASNTQLAHVNGVNLPGLTGRRERSVTKQPAAGRWRIRVANTIGLTGTPQTYKGIFDLARVEYAPLSDLGGLSAAQQDEIRQVLRTFVMFPAGGQFQPAATVSRADFAGTLVRGARVPQYVPAYSSFTDVTDAVTLNYAASVQSAPGGPLLYDAAPGGAFRPDDPTTRLAATVALVRAAGLRHEAENYTGTTYVLADRLDIPAEYAGYVNLAIARGLVAPHGAYFHPHSPLTRAELARAMVKVAELAAK